MTKKSISEGETIIPIPKTSLITMDNDRTEKPIETYKESM
jgi:hypothetical protein